MISLRRRHPAANPAPVWEPVRPCPEWLPDDGLVITDPDLVGPSIWRAIYLCNANRCAWITVCGYAIWDDLARGYRTRVAIRYTRTDVPGWACWTTHTMPLVFSDHPGWPAHDLIEALNLAQRAAGSARGFFPDVFTWDTDPGSLYSGEMP